MEQRSEKKFAQQAFRLYFPPAKSVLSKKTFLQKKSPHRMAKQEELPNFKMGYGRLIQRADSLDNTLERDKDILAAERGLTPERRAELMTRRNALSSHPTDEEAKVDVGIAAENKEASRRTLEVGMRDFRGMAATKFGEGSARFKAFKFDDLTRLEDNQLARGGRRVVRLATRFLTVLESEGMTLVKIGKLRTDTDKFDLDIDLVDAAEEERDDLTQDRIVLGNAVYDTLTELAGIGRAHWIDKDEAKANDYVIDDQPDPTEPDTPTA